MAEGNQGATRRGGRGLDGPRFCLPGRSLRGRRGPGTVIADGRGSQAANTRLRARVVELRGLQAPQGSSGRGLWFRGRLRAWVPKCKRELGAEQLGALGPRVGRD